MLKIRFYFTVMLMSVFAVACLGSVTLTHAMGVDDEATETLFAVAMLGPRNVVLQRGDREQLLHQRLFKSAARSLIAVGLPLCIITGIPVFNSCVENCSWVPSFRCSLLLYAFCVSFFISGMGLSCLCRMDNRCEQYVVRMAGVHNRV